MSAAAIEWLEEHFKAVAAALEAARRGDPLGNAERDLLREARAASGAMPPRPSVAAWDLTGRAWRWRPLEEPGPDDWRSCP